MILASVAETRNPDGSTESAKDAVSKSDKGGESDETV
jgi:hypothetical protein